jgi:hypothetical protein
MAEVGRGRSRWGSERKEKRKKKKEKRKKKKEKPKELHGTERDGQGKIRHWAQ